MTTAAAIAVQQRDGEVVMFGLRLQHSAQTHGTFKLLFNALVSHAADGAGVAAEAANGARR